MKSLCKQIKSEKKKKKQNIDKTKQLENEFFKIKYINNPTELQPE